MRTVGNLASCIEELVDESLAAVKEDRVNVRVELVSNKLLDVLLNLRPELLIVTHEQLQQLANKPASSSIRHQLTIMSKHHHDNISSSTHLRATERHLPYGIIQCYVPPNTGKCALP